MNHRYNECCDAERDARLMGYKNAKEADRDNWGQPWPVEEIPKVVPKPKEKSS